VVAPHCFARVVEEPQPLPDAEIRSVRNISREVEARSGRGGAPGGIEGRADEKGEPMLVDGGAEDGVPKAEKTREPQTIADFIEGNKEPLMEAPRASFWFDDSSIHVIEKRSLPEFFEGKSEELSPELYKTYRDKMIDLWKNNSREFLSISTACKSLRADVGVVMRVHTFLEHWGLINRAVEPIIVTAPGPKVGSTTTSEKNHPANSGPFLYDDPEPTTSTKTFKTRTEVFFASAVLEFACDSCGKICSARRFQSSAEICVCPQCYALGRYPVTLQSSDFVHMTSIPGGEGTLDESVWSREETLLLLEGLEMYAENWDLVAEHVGTKGRDACIMQFLRLPIEETFLSEVSRDPLDNNGDFGEAPSADALPFAGAPNPVMALISFLASAVSPEIAATAARAALGGIMNPPIGPKPAPSSGVTRDAKVESETGAGDAATNSAAAPEPRANSDSKPEPTRDSAQSAPKAEPVAESKLEPKAEPVPKAEESSKASVPSALPAPQNGGFSTPGLILRALDAAAARAGRLARKETRELDRLFAMVVELKLRAIDLKVQHFQALEGGLLNEAARLGELGVKRLPSTQE